MGLYFFLRYGIASLAFIGWFFYQKQFNRRTWAELKPDAIAITCFIAVWFSITYWVMS